MGGGGEFCMSRPVFLMPYQNGLQQEDETFRLFKLRMGHLKMQFLFT